MADWLHSLNEKNETVLVPCLYTEEEFTKYLNTLKVNFSSLVETNKKLLKENEELKERLTQKITPNSMQIDDVKFFFPDSDDNTAYNFPITKEEAKAIREWEDRHDEVQHNNKNHDHGTIGGGFTYKFSRSSIGVFGCVVCPTCQAKARAAAIKDGKFNFDLYDNYMEQHYATFYFQEP